MEPEEIAQTDDDRWGFQAAAACNLDDPDCEACQ